MKNLKNSFYLGIGLGLLLSSSIILLIDLVFYLVQSAGEKPILQPDVIFAIGVFANLLPARKFFRMENKQSLGQGFVFAALLGGAIYIYLFQVLHLNSIIFHH